MDELKRQANLDKHEIDFASVTLSFFETAVVRPVRGGRFMAIGYLGDRPVSMVFKPLGKEAVSLISVRSASRKEKTEL